MSDPNADRILPEPIKKRRAAWRRLFLFCSWIHWAVGIIGILTSTLAATDLLDGVKPQWHLSKWCAVISGACLAVMGFINPQRQYARYVRAWRILDPACIRFELGVKPEEKQLIDELERAENSIFESELGESESRAALAQATKTLAEVAKEIKR